MKICEYLVLDQCPHCGIKQPSLFLEYTFETFDCDSRYRRLWGVYACKRCGGAVLAGTYLLKSKDVTEYYPRSLIIENSIPKRARMYLQQALDNLHVPIKSVMLSVSAVDAMLQEKGFKKGKLHSRIDEAKKVHLITDEMAAWAHDLRLDGNNTSEVDNEAAGWIEKEAKNCINFTLALTEYFYVLPAKVERERSWGKLDNE